MSVSVFNARPTTQYSSATLRPSQDTARLYTNNFLGLGGPAIGAAVGTDSTAAAVPLVTEVRQCRRPTTFW